MISLFIRFDSLRPINNLSVIRAVGIGGGGGGLWGGGGGGL